ncbi:hypothetical protein DERF_006593 [Dermatophagoides farinae]|uniref:Transmembrane protein n=1 Tax=Dermatophagoides farinae TaxID=6954 RepID=A0A922L277_DERFA|nr:hypothetical protein DERF_006593 [Dermatophagoides farinae]
MKRKKNLFVIILTTFLIYSLIFHLHLHLKVVALKFSVLGHTSHVLILHCYIDLILFSIEDIFVRTYTDVRKYPQTRCLQYTQWHNFSPMEIYSFQQHKQQQKSTYIQDIKSMKSYSDKQLFYSSFCTFYQE